MSKIWKLPRWRIWSFPVEFRKARFQSLDHCDQFVALNCVRSNGFWTMYPWFNTAPVHEHEAVGSEIRRPASHAEGVVLWGVKRTSSIIHADGVRVGIRPDFDSLPSLDTALEQQLGLKLVARGGPVDIYVIDHVERPSEN